MGVWSWLKGLFGGVPAEPAPPLEETSTTEPAPPAAVRSSFEPDPPAGPTPPNVSRPPADLLFQRSDTPPARPSRPLPPRRYHLGLDWGTSTTKMVLRDYGAPGAVHGLAYVLEPEGSLRYPSTVACMDGRLYFGHEAERRRDRPGAKLWDSLKRAAGVGNGWSEPAGLDQALYEDLVTLSLAHMIALGLRHAEQLANGAFRVVLGLSVGVPAWDAQHRHLPYLRCAATGYRLAVGRRWDPQGRPLAEALPLVKEVRAEVLSSLDTSLPNSERWLRAEVVAALIWPLTSPETGEGPYTIVDIGAATTHASWLRVHHSHDEAGRYLERSAITVFGTKTRPVAMDDLDKALAAALGLSSWERLRGRENEHTATSTGEVAGVLGAMFETWAEARVAAAHQGGHGQATWGGLKVLLIGGGSKVTRVQRAFSQLPGAAQGQFGALWIVPPARPSDLRRLPGDDHRRVPLDVTFLLVAYGLAFHTGDLPEIFLGGARAVGRQPPPPPRPTPEELGYDNP